MKAQTVILLFFLYPFCSTFGQALNTLTVQEKEQGWKLVFDGKSFDGLRKLAEGGWEVKNGTLSATPIPHGKQMDIITEAQFESFELSFEFTLSKNTNSGIKYLVTNDYENQKGTYLGLEYQLLDDRNYQYPERGYLRSLASLYDLIPSDSQKTVKPIGQWNTAKITVNGKLVTHWLNGDKVVEYDRSTDSFALLIKDSKYKSLRHFGKAKKGHLLFQNEGTPIAFRNIKIKELLIP